MRKAKSALTLSLLVSVLCNPTAIAEGRLPPVLLDSHRALLPGAQSSRPVDEAELCIIKSIMLLAADPMPEVHPVLGVKPFQYLDGKILDSSAFKKLNGCLKLKKPYKNFDDSYEISEEEATDQFCHQVKGLTMTEVVRLAGQPYSKGGDSFSRPEATEGEKNWLFVFGLTPELVRLVFDRNVCINAWFNPCDMDPWYCQWRWTEIRKYAVGKTILEIIHAEGPPHEVRQLLSPGNSVLDYIFDRKPVWIYIHDGRCTALGGEGWGLCGGPMNGRKVTLETFGEPALRRRRQSHPSRFHLPSLNVQTLNQPIDTLEHATEIVRYSPGETVENSSFKMPK